ncbi:COG1361 S-layer family protein [Haloplanus rubicundus]|uniref:Sialidase n=1 Tax=Haloplanus rubicundus TaxID=1547898 RepID=A0A345EAP8_9EURY|nr:COG1361 S-layer family protein [Haloplanus rubicundus]AXG09270.1 sialidase [Haloplanus rubicundus]
MTASRSRVVVVGLLLLLAAVAPVVGVEQVIGSPDVDVFSPDNEVHPGEETTLPVYLSNTGQLRQSGPAEYVDRVTTARGLTFTVSDGDAPIDVNTGRYPVGSVPEGTAGPFPVSITVAEDAPPGTYRLPVRVRYAYTLMVDYSTSPPDFVDSTRDRRQYLTVVVRDVPRFEVVNTSSSVGVGGRGNVSVTVENVGTDPARDATLRLDSPSDEVFLGTRSTSSRAFTGTWNPGERRTFAFAARTTDDAVIREYPLVARVAYRDRDGIGRTSRELTTGFTPLPEQTFAVSNLSTDLYVGEPGTIRGTVVNTGPRTVTDATLVYTSSTPNLQPVDREVALGRLAPGERHDFAYEMTVSERASATTLPANLSVRYRDGEGNRGTSDPLEPSVVVAPERTWLAVTPESNTFTVDSENRLTIRIRNVEGVPLRNVVARLSVDAPFETESRVAYVDDLRPNASATLAFELTVSEDAVPTRSSVRLNVTADRPDGETIHLDTYDVPVVVADEAGPTDIVVLVAGSLVALALLVGGWLWIRR